MRRPLPALGAASAALLALALGAPGVAGSAQAAEPTCHGKSATIVGTKNQQITATDGDDVVVTQGAATIDLGAGDDTVCVTGVFPQGTDGGVGVYDGPGSDLIDTTASRNPEIYTFLGTAQDDLPTDDVDTFVGGPQIDVVYDYSGGFVDIRTGAGKDQVNSALGGAGLTVDLGPGVDTFSVDDVVADRGEKVSIDGGADRDYLDLDSATAGSWVVDNRLGVVTLDGEDQVEWSGVEAFWVALRGQTTFLGGDAGEQLLGLCTECQTAPATVTMGGGDDRVVVEQNAYVLDGGEGIDELVVSVYHGRGVPRDPDYVSLDLGAETLDFGAGKPVRTVRGFENGTVSDPHDPITLVGTEGANRLRAGFTGCDVSLLGRGGNDRLSTFDLYGTCASSQRLMSGGSGNDLLFGTSGDDVLYGGAGDDRLLGYAGDDVLNAGEGSDSVVGGSGSDRCRNGEDATGCER